MNHTEKTIPVWKKYSLNVSEAAEYYGIGEKRLRQIAGENEGADFILEVGSHIRFKRKLFEDYDIEGSLVYKVFDNYDDVSAFLVMKIMFILS